MLLCLCIRSRISFGASDSLPSWSRLWIISEYLGVGSAGLVFVLGKGEGGGKFITRIGVGEGEREERKSIHNLQSFLLCHTCSCGTVGFE